MYVRHSEPSMLYSVDDDAQPNEFLFNLSIEAIQIAGGETIVVSNKSLRIDDHRWLNQFPGEHYRILRGFAKALNSSFITELGTATGAATISFLQANDHNTVHTFDIEPWNDSKSHITKNDLDSGKIVYHLADLSDLNLFEKYKDILNQSDIIFSDGPKDGIFENKFLGLLSMLDPKPNKLLILDDTRLLRDANMVDTWRRIQSPKLDITSFGHWAGTGIVDISEPLMFIK